MTQMRLIVLATAALIVVGADAATASIRVEHGDKEILMLAQADISRPTEPLLRKILGELGRAAPDYASMEPDLQQAVRAQIQAVTGLLDRLGAVQAVEFAGTRNGADFYRVTFQNGVTTWTIQVSPAGRIAGLSFRPLPAPETVGEEVLVADLSGTLIKPPGVDRPPVVLLIAGSGPTDRNGSQSGSGPGELRQIAEALAARGIASLRYDKRGIGRSATAMLREEDVTFDHIVDDAAAWLAFLEKRPELGPRIVAGHSEGGMIAIHLAKRGLPAAIVLLATPGRRLGDVMRDQIDAGGWPRPLHDEARSTLAALERGESVVTVSAGLRPLFRPSVQPFLRSELALDPAASLHALTLPVLIVSGGHDLQVGDADAAALAQARPDAARFHVAEMNHVLKIAPADSAEQQKTRDDPTVALAPGLIDAIVTFVGQSVRPPK